MDFFQTKIEFLKGVGPKKGAILGKEMGVFTFGDLLEVFPFRYEDKTKYYKISELRSDLQNVQIRGKIRNVAVGGSPRQQRLTAIFADDTGQIELVWFKGVNWIKKTITIGGEYIIFGKPSVFSGRINIAHPEIEPYKGNGDETDGAFLSPIYPSTDGLKRGFLDSKGISKLVRALLPQALNNFQESLPPYLCKMYGLVSKREAMANIHFPKDVNSLNKATARLKFEELFYIQLKLLSEKSKTKQEFAGHVFKSLKRLKIFYEDILPFDLTGAQKRVIKEIRADVVSGKQMNRLLQGDVGSGKTIVAFICMLMTVDNDSQSCLMAPTEILAEQHYEGLKEYCEKLDLRLELLTGSSKTAKRREIDEGLRSGDIDILVGTHALLEDKVVYKNLGLCVIDEQHRFGVAQRAR